MIVILETLERIVKKVNFTSLKWHIPFQPSFLLELPREVRIDTTNSL